MNISLSIFLGIIILIGVFSLSFIDNLNVARIVSRTLVVLGIVNLIFTLNLLNKNKN
ncbi:hypothetical protein [Bacillus sp. ISL-57]|uniref:hypothetical protein n=1 Tax=Bacillus sp. ISL-57 TaxID=2819135 RepID=UPI001BE8BE80|nr:hypothetical protein [Bacillus sp. ISL-57]MBT2719255.1 hypothetical protein [Bacillus sp. ISL-57]